MSESLTEVKTLYRRPPLRWFISNLKGSWKAGNNNCAFGNEESSFVSAIERTSTLFPTMSQRFSNLLRIEFMFIYEKIILLGFFGLNLPKWDTFEAINEEPFLRLLTCSSMLLYNQSELTIFAIFFTLSSQSSHWLGDTLTQRFCFDQFWKFKFHFEHFPRNTPFLSFDRPSNHLYLFKNSRQTSL